MTSIKNIQRNSIYLAVRLALSLFISFFTTRFLLQELGIVDFGIYTVVGGVVASFSFFTNSLMASAQRQFAFQIGNNNTEALNGYFNAHIRITIVIGVLLFIIEELFATAIVCDFLSIPIDRQPAAIWALRFLTFVFIIQIISTSYQAVIHAKEDMHILAIRNLMENIFALGVVCVLMVLEGDKLIYYSGLMLLLSASINFSFYWYCKRKYPEIHLVNIAISKTLYKDIASFSGWTLFGSLGSISRVYGLSVLLNLFFGPIINSAHGIANQLTAKLATISDIMVLPFSPQIIKAFANRELNKANSLMMLSAKLVTIVVLGTALPLIIHAEFVLDFWLNDFPPESIKMTQILLLNAILWVPFLPLVSIINASGSIKNYQLAIGIVFISTIPIIYQLYSMGYSLFTAFYFFLITTVVGDLIKLFFAYKITKFNIFGWFKNLFITSLILVGVYSLLHVGGHFLEAYFSNTVMVEILVYYGFVGSYLYLQYFKKVKQP